MPCPRTLKLSESTYCNITIRARHLTTQPSEPQLPRRSRSSGRDIQCGYHPLPLWGWGCPPSASPHQQPRYHPACRPTMIHFHLVPLVKVCFSSFSSPPSFNVWQFARMAWSFTKVNRGPGSCELAVSSQVRDESPHERRRGRGPLDTIDSFPANDCREIPRV